MTHNVKTLTTDQIRSVYSGRANHCNCGCAGIHRYNSKFANSPHELINDKQITRVLNAIKKNEDKIDSNEDEYVSVTVGNRTYIAYLELTVAGWSTI
jgi:hypothetical protein